MPSKTPKQAKFMRAIAHGWTPSRAKNPPSRAVAQEFVNADRKYSGGFAENRYWVGGLAAMDQVNAGLKGSLDTPFQAFEEGGDVVTDEALQKARAVADARLGNYKAARFTLGKDHSATKKLKESYLEAKHKAVDMANRVGAGAGGGGGAGYQRGGRAGRRGGRRTNGGAGTSTTTNVPTVTAPDVSPYGTEAGTTQQMFDRMGYSGPIGYLRTVSDLRQAGWTPASGGSDDLRNRMWYPPEQTLTGEDAPPPRIIPTDPASYIGGAALGTSDGEGGGGGSGEGSEHREQLRKHQMKIAAILGSARGGHVNYYDEGGAVRPGHAEGPNPHNKAKTPGMWATWERKYHIDPPPPPEVAEEVAEEGGVANWLRSLFTPDPETAIGSGEARGTIEEQMEAEGQAYGGRVRYQAGGLAIAAPAGGVPPWIAPTGSGPGYMDEPPPGYQFGGIADRFNPPPAAAPAAAVAPPQGQIMNRAQSEFNAQTGGPRGGVMGGPPGGLAAMQQQAEQQRAGVAGRLPPGIDPRAVAANPEGWARQQAEMQRMQSNAGGAPGFAPGEGDLMRQQEGARSIMDRIGGGGGRFGAEMRRARGMQTYQDVVNRGEGGINPRLPGGGRMYGGDGEVGINPPPSGPFQPPPGRRVIGGSGKFGDPYQYGRGSGGKPRPGPGMMPPGEEGGGIPGGPRVPPNMRGYLQKQRMMNRPPANVGGGANRVGMQDQQGALSRAMQRGTGRAPPSRRFGRGRAGAGRGFQQR